MIGDLFDSPWKVLIVAVVLIVLFGSKKLPHAARSLGQSMRILKREVQGLHEEEETVPGAPASHPHETLRGAVFRLQQRARGPTGGSPTTPEDRC